MPTNVNRNRKYIIVVTALTRKTGKYSDRE